jgi:hypothetical protein
MKGFAACATIIGMLIVMAAISELIKERKRIKRCNCKTEGIIIDARPHEVSSTDDNGHTHYHTEYNPIIQYQMENGELITIEAKANSTRYLHKVTKGTKVIVQYNPADPYEFTVNNKNKYGSDILGIFVGLVFVIMGIILWKYYNAV